MWKCNQYVLVWLVWLTEQNRVSFTVKWIMLLLTLVQDPVFLLTGPWLPAERAGGSSRASKAQGCLCRPPGTHKHYAHSGFTATARLWGSSVQGPFRPRSLCVSGSASCWGKGAEVAAVSPPFPVGSRLHSGPAREDLSTQWATSRLKLAFLYFRSSCLDAGDSCLGVRASLE